MTPQTSHPLDFSFLAGINPELYKSIGKTLDAIYPGLLSIITLFY